MEPRGPLDAGEWRKVLQRLSEELDGHSANVFVIGGVAVALGYSLARRTTGDLDALFEPATAEIVRSAAARIAPEFGLQTEWLNDNALRRGFVTEMRTDGPIVFESISLHMAAPSREHLLAMKVAAMRTDVDVDDVLYLMQGMTDDAGELWNLIGGMIPAAYRPAAEENLARAIEVKLEREAAKRP